MRLTTSSVHINASMRDGTSFATAVRTEVKEHKSYHVTMPSVSGSIVAKARTVQAGQRKFHLDTGASFCAISHAAFVRDKAHLLKRVL